jgi:hypothetical protein
VTTFKDYPELNVLASLLAKDAPFDNPENASEPLVADITLVEEPPQVFGDPSIALNRHLTKKGLEFVKRLIGSDFQG